uniref:Uncharacterized protein n=1 Tax=Timema douglasi TaxID=61478 RepID=A0A7R8VKX9_TIMDO|nr:unnamed protein product [Timema douglasi]
MQRSVYPERLELDSLVKTRLTATLKAPINSWCYNGGLAESRNSASKIATVFLSESKEEVRSQPEVPLLSAASLEQGSCEGEFATSAICRSGSSNSSVLRAEGHLFIHQRIRYLVQAFTERAQRIRRRLEQPPTPSTVSSEPGDSNDTRTPPPFHRTHLFRRESRESSVCRTFWTRVKDNLSCGPVIDPETTSNKLDQMGEYSPSAMLNSNSGAHVPRPPFPNTQFHGLDADMIRLFAHEGSHAQKEHAMATPRR